MLELNVSISSGMIGLVFILLYIIYLERKMTIQIKPYFIIALFGYVVNLYALMYLHSETVELLNLCYDNNITLNHKYDDFVQDKKVKLYIKKLKSIKK